MRASLACVALAATLLLNCTFDSHGQAIGGGDGGAFDAGDGGGGCTPSCDGTVQVRCEGQDEVRVQCEATCTVDPGQGPVCLALAPSNGVTSAEQMGVTAGLSVPDGKVAEIIVATGQIVVDGTEVRAAGTEVQDGIRFTDGTYYVYTMTQLAVGQNASLHLQIENATDSKPVILYVVGAVTLHGVIDSPTRCGGDRSCPGAGGGRGSDGATPAGGCGPGGNGDDSQDTGGGGGGFGDLGGVGGSSGAVLGGTGGDPIGGCPGPALIPLAGGSGGGQGSASGGVGGGGGGAVQITSHASITIDCTDPKKCGLNLGGGGGTGADNQEGGGGGGSGGAILLEAPTITVAANAVLAANGGGGGEGDGNGSRHGEDGALDDSAAQGGGNGPTGGGNGGFLAIVAAPGLGTGNNGTGGGGGSVGRIHVNTRPFGLTLMGIRSPEASTGTIAPQ